VGAGHQRDPDPNDGRAFVVSATSAGRQLVKKTTPLSFGLRQRAMIGVSEADEEIMIRALKQMLMNLRSGD